MQKRAPLSWRGFARRLEYWLVQHWVRHWLLAGCASQNNNIYSEGKKGVFFLPYQSCVPSLFSHSTVPASQLTMAPSMARREVQPVWHCTPRLLITSLFGNFKTTIPQSIFSFISVAFTSAIQAKRCFGIYNNYNKLLVLIARWFEHNAEPE